MKNKLFKKILLLLLVAFITIFAGCASPSNNSGSIDSSKNNASSVNSNEASAKSKASANNENSQKNAGQLKVHFINVGQGDAILVQNGTSNMLIDTGTNESKNTLLSYLKGQNITKLDYLILTHPHEDHIGGADDIINNFEIGNVYMPKVTDNTKTFKSVVSAMKKKGLTAKVPNCNDTFNLGGAACTILGPVKVKEKDLNTYSIVLKVVFGKNKFLFTGDAQSSNETDMIKSGLDLSADVLKVGHHGSSTSTSKAFLEKVNPKFAVISCGINNDYGHPHKTTVERLKSKGIPIYRTDESGNIVCTSDGNNISFSVKPGDYKFGASK